MSEHTAGERCAPGMATPAQPPKAPLAQPQPAPFSPLTALALIARFHQIAADPATLAHQLGLQPSHNVSIEDLLRGAHHVLNLLMPYLEPGQRAHLLTLASAYTSGTLAS